MTQLSFNGVCIRSYIKKNLSDLGLQDLLCLSRGITSQYSCFSFSNYPIIIIQCIPCHYEIIKSHRIFMLVYTLLFLCFHVSLAFHLPIHEPMHLAYKDNLLVQNWYYGTIDQMAYRLRVFEIAVNEVTNPCPMDAPFANKQMNKCEQCPEERPLRNIGSYSCEPCPYGQQFSKVYGNCTEMIEKEPKEQQRSMERLPIPEIVIPNQPKQNPIKNQPQNPPNQKQVQYFEPIVVMPQKSKDTTSPSKETNKERANEQISIEQSININFKAEDKSQNIDMSEHRDRKGSDQNYQNFDDNGQIDIREDTQPGSHTTHPNINNTELDNDIISNKTQMLPQKQPIEQQQPHNTNLTVTQPKASNNANIGVISHNGTNNTMNANFTDSQSNTNLIGQATNIPRKTITQQEVTGPVIDMDPKYARDIYQATIQQDNQQIPACPEQTPYWDQSSSKCISCPQTTKFISIFSQCMHYAYLFNLNAKQAMSSKNNTIQKLNQQVRQKYLSELILECPADQPYVGVNLLGRMYCLQCNDNQDYDLDQRQCKNACNQKQGFSYEKNRSICIKKQKEEVSQVKQQYTPISEIKLPLVNLTGTKKNTCPSWIPVLDQKTNTCQQCPYQHQYHPSTQKCLPFLHIPNPNSDKLIMPTPLYFQKYEAFIKSTNPRRKVVECPIDKPYINRSQCIRCPNEKQYYLLINQQCVEGCPFGTIYSEMSRTCKNGKYLTNIDATRLYFKTQKIYISWIQANKNSKEHHPDNQYCPFKTPFVQNGRCIDCKGQYPLYDAQMEKCTKCYSGTRYNKQSRLCQTTQS